MVRRSTVIAVALVGALVVLGAPIVADHLSNDARATVCVETANGTVVLELVVADTAQERYEGLSGTRTIPADGMLFSYSRAGERTFVMRGMNYPLDIVFVADGAVTRVHHAPVEDPPLTEYSGRARYVLELPYNWTRRHGVTVESAVTAGNECFVS